MAENHLCQSASSETLWGQLIAPCDLGQKIKTEATTKENKTRYVKQQEGKAKQFLWEIIMFKGVHKFLEFGSQIHARKDCENSKFTFLAELQAQCKQEMKAKAELHVAWLDTEEPSAKI